MLHHSFFLLVWALAVMEQGRLQEVRFAVDQAYERAAVRHNLTARGWSAAASARLAFLAGDLDTSARRCAEASSLFAETNNPRFRRLHLGMHAHVELLRGDRAAARDLLGEVADDGSSVGVLEPDVLRARARDDWESGRAEQAHSRLVAAVDDVTGRGSHLLGLALLHDMAVLGEPRRAMDLLARRAVPAVGPLPTARLSHIEALAVGSDDALEEVAGRFEELGAMLMAAEAADAAAARALRAGRRARAEGLRARAHQLVAACGARSTAAARGGVASVLTRREHEVARLVADGRSNTDVAEELAVSVRTVENHLQRAYDKLGVQSREGLIERLR
jgi:DNA-binding CsgD family transcriptional regulator